MEILMLANCIRRRANRRTLNGRMWGKRLVVQMHARINKNICQVEEEKMMSTTTRALISTTQACQTRIPQKSSLVSGLSGKTWFAAKVFRHKAGNLYRLLCPCVRTAKLNWLDSVQNSKYKYKIVNFQSENREANRRKWTDLLAIRGCLRAYIKCAYRFWWE